MKARCYREIKGQPYTRKKYIRGSPPPKITKFTMGDASGSFEYHVFLVAQKAAQVRHDALEATRIATNRFLSDKLGNNYCLQILPYPHVVLRENKMIFGPHADRLQDGMRQAFGKPIGTAARVKTNQAVMMVRVNETGLETAKEALKRGRAKLPIPCRIFAEKTIERAPWCVGGGFKFAHVFHGLTFRALEDFTVASNLKIPLGVLFSSHSC